MDNFSTLDFGVVTMSLMGTSGTDTTPTSQNIFDLAIDRYRYGFHYPVFDEENGYGVDVDVSENDVCDNKNDDENMQKTCHPLHRHPTEGEKITLTLSDYQVLLDYLFKDFKSFPIR